MLPKSPRKAVNILKHLWDQIYKSSPRKRTLMDTMWSKDNLKIGKYMYLVGKYRKGKNEFQLGSTVKNMKKTFHFITKCLQAHKYALESISFMH